MAAAPLAERRPSLPLDCPHPRKISGYVTAIVPAYNDSFSFLRIFRILDAHEMRDEVMQLAWDAFATNIYPFLQVICA